MPPRQSKAFNRIKTPYREVDEYDLTSEDEISSICDEMDVMESMPSREESNSIAEHGNFEVLMIENEKSHSGNEKQQHEESSPQLSDTVMRDGEERHTEEVNKECLDVINNEGNDKTNQTDEKESVECTNVSVQTDFINYNCESADSFD